VNPGHLIRRLRETDEDIALGMELVREYVVATAAEIAQDVDLILPLIGELHDFRAHYLERGALLAAGARIVTARR
jgi:hypothetical protein